MREQSREPYVGGPGNVQDGRGALQPVTSENTGTIADLPSPASSDGDRDRGRESKIRDRESKEPSLRSLTPAIDILAPSPDRPPSKSLSRTYTGADFSHTPFRDFARSTGGGKATLSLSTSSESKEGKQRSSRGTRASTERPESKDAKVSQSGPRTTSAQTSASVTLHYRQ